MQHLFALLMTLLATGPTLQAALLHFVQLHHRSATCSNHAGCITMRSVLAAVHLDILDIPNLLIVSRQLVRITQCIGQ